MPPPWPLSKQFVLFTLKGTHSNTPARIICHQQALVVPMHTENSSYTQAKRRLANEGHPYTYADFLDHYGNIAHSLFLASPLVLVEPTLEQPYRQHLLRTPWPGYHSVLAKFVMPGRSAPQPKPLSAPHVQTQLEAPLTSFAQLGAALPVQ